ncbi:helix-turn-helix domain-containing protein, partial [Salmonella enterica]|nr:AraC family transcriptional regulator [Salmonella enterica]EEL4302783.1 helix-turn-helix domain-containing protein [Salmonella enterica]
GGDSVIIPSWDCFTESSYVRMAATSILINMSEISNDINVINKLCWKRVGEFNYGDSINRIITGGISGRDKNKATCKKALNVIKGLLQLELDDIESASVSPLFDINGIMLFIKSNYRNQDFCASTIANFLSISNRMLQYKFSRYDLKPSQLISLERSRAIARYIREYPYAPIDAVAFDCGFNSIVTARKQFKNFFGLTISEYAKKYRILNNSNMALRNCNSV